MTNRSAHSPEPATPGGAIIDGFIELFQGNRNALGTEEGGCERISAEDWDLFLEAHLRGADVTLGGPGPRGPIGVYPMVQRGLNIGMKAAPWFVRWGCVDFDEGEEESYVHGVNVRSALEQFGITAWIERSRSKGFHVWVFASDWVPAGTMRSALLAACQLVGAPTKEINPKQVELGEGQLGNYVRLPYPERLGSGHIQLPQRRVVIDHNTHPLGLYDFVPAALKTRTNEAQLSQVAALLKGRPIVLRTVPIKADIASSVDSVKRLSGLAYTILMEGPKDGVDRSTTLWKLATRIHDDGSHTFEEALDIMIQADLAWGKFMERGDSGERELRRLLEKVWDGV